MDFLHSRIFRCITLPLSGVLLFISSVIQADDTTRVYITRDANGNPVFTDKPSKGAEVRDIKPVSTIPAMKLPPKSSATRASDQQASYQSLDIISPSEQENIPVGLANQLMITFSLTPDLMEGDSVRVKDNGNTIRTGTSTNFSLGDLNRGEHRLSVEVVNQKDEVMISSGTRTVYVQRPKQN